MINGLSWWVPNTFQANPHLINVFSKNIFSESECMHIRKIKKILDFQHGKFGEDGKEGRKGDLRSSQIAWFKGVKENQVEWLYSKLGKELVEMNKQWKFNIVGFTEPFQYTVYHASEEGKYDSHMDIGRDSWYRKISITVQLSHPDEYEGGDLMIGDQPTEKQQGMMVAFPSFREHRVTPITKGTRESLVIWVSGPAWQ